MLSFFQEMKNRPESFTKAEKLCGIKAINELFVSGRSLYFNTLRVIFTITPAEKGRPAARLLVSVPKRYFKKAVTRNLLKRRIREAYRKNKQPLLNYLENSDKCFDLAIIWNSNKPSVYSEIEKSIRDMVHQLTHLR